MPEETSGITKELRAKLDEVLHATNIEAITSTEEERTELGDGYYLCEVEKAELSISKSSGNPMVAIRFNIVENGQRIDSDDGIDTTIILENTKGRKIFKYYPLTDSSNVTKFVRDMLKFEGEEKGVPLLPAQAWLTSDLIEDALDVLVIQASRVYVSITGTTTNEDGTTTNWKNPISWERAGQLGLPID